METWKIVLISIAVILVVIGIICAIVIPIVLKKKKAKKETVVSDNTIETAPDKEVIQLQAVKLLAGSGKFGFETNEELRERVSKLSKEAFLALEIKDYPYNMEQWNALEGKPEEIYARNEYEMGIYFAYDYNKKLKSNADIINREF